MNDWAKGRGEHSCQYFMSSPVYSLTAREGVSQLDCAPWCQDETAKVADRPQSRSHSVTAPDKSCANNLPWRFGTCALLLFSLLNL